MIFLKDKLILMVFDDNGTGFKTHIFINDDIIDDIFVELKIIPNKNNKLKNVYIKENLYILYMNGDIIIYDSQKNIIINKKLDINCILDSHFDHFDCFKLLILEKAKGKNTYTIYIY